MVARTPRYTPAPPGIYSAARMRATGQNGSPRHVLALFNSSSRRIKRTEQRTLNPRARRPSYRLPCVNPDDYCLRLVMRCLTGGSTARPPARPEVCSARTPLPVSHPGGGASGHRRGDSPARWRSPGRPPAGTSTARARAGRRRTSGPNAPPIPARRATRCPRKGTKRAWIGRASGYTHR